MVGTITPVVYGQRRWARLMLVYSASQVAGATIIGVLLATVGIALSAWTSWEPSDLLLWLSVLTVVGSLYELRLLPRVRMPSSRWQVPRSWKRLSPPLMCAGYGFGIGLVVFVQISVVSIHYVLAVSMGLSSVMIGAGLMALHGAARAGAAWIVGLVQARTPNALAGQVTLMRITPLVRYLDGLVLGLLSGPLLARLFLASLT